MKIINCIQGSDEWRQARCGVVTASRFADVMTGMTTKRSWNLTFNGHRVNKLTEKQGNLVALLKTNGEMPEADLLTEADCTASPLKNLERRELVHCTEYPHWQLSKTAESYLNELIGERLSGEPADTINHKILQWGTDHEPIARDLYERRYGVDVEQTGLITDDGRLVGCSVDGLVGDDIGIEIKCRWTSREHIKTIRAGAVPDEYIWQVQGGMWITNRPEWHFISYDPRMPDFTKAFYRIVVNRDEQQIKELSHAVAAFLAKLDEEQERVEECLQLKNTRAA